ncbi:MAG TPA: ATP-binding protein [Gemmataceae bacterium]|nr:ATP-binding protein [Gemmataceae bacterium]
MQTERQGKPEGSPHLHQAFRGDDAPRDSVEAGPPETHEYFRQLVGPVQDYAIYLLDPQGHVLSWNAGGERIKGYTAAEIIGQHFSRFYPAEVVEQGWPQHELEVAEREGRFEDEGWRVRKDGRRFWAYVVITSWKDAAGNLKGFLKITRDLTDRKEAEEALRASEEQLKALAQRLQRSNRELEQFASVAAHDLQEPLRKIEAFGDRLRAKCGDQLGEQGKDYLERMQGSAVRMRRLINDLLAFSRVTTKAKPFEPVDLSEIAQETLADLEGSIQQTKGRVEIGELSSVEADPLQMHQLLQNLIGNGLKFHKPEEPPVVKVTSRLVHEPGRAHFCEITVEDNGIGFEEQYLDRIFQVFQRLHGRQEYEGTGIGLAICRKIVERHGGVITARSQPGRGAAFIVRLPIEQAKEGGDRGESREADHDLDGGR